MIPNLLVLLDFGSKHQQYSSETNVIGRGFSLAVNAGSNPCRGADRPTSLRLIGSSHESAAGPPSGPNSSWSFTHLPANFDAGSAQLRVVRVLQDYGPRV
jgi:hypothetical protein